MQTNVLSQKEFVLMALAMGQKLTPAKAIAEFNIWRLAAIIHKLKAEGASIRSEWKYSVSGKRYAEYSLE